MNGDRVAERGSMTQDQWGRVKQQIQQSVGQSNFKNWIEPLEFTDVSEGVAIFEVPTGFIGNYVSRHFGDLILYQISSFDPQVRKLDFRVAPREAERPARSEASSPAAASQPARRDAILPSAPLDDRFRFETFVVGKPNELAHAAAKRVAEGGLFRGTFVRYRPQTIFPPRTETGGGQAGHDGISSSIDAVIGSRHRLNVIQGMRNIRMI